MPKISTSNARPGCEDIGFIIDELGYVITTQVQLDWKYDTQPSRFDVVEYLKRNPVLEDIIDILEIGYWRNDGKYIAYEKEFVEWTQRNKEWSDAQTK